ncbi:P-loop containing nucleoside triphosphate hydrolase protein [Leucogyrophana mollusca]|uniref:P-loop containing nucleoside triphosphate hydrolase protein n=1 Tax=Leucogyrophana mollusca TaxID=85980 RepID=A0ACB8BRJ7_9AGAM|nr:P-loop containing nucleoside triphosphate hydrolase protein [Leucogyrophana mollusca]
MSMELDDGSEYRASSSSESSEDEEDNRLPNFPCRRARGPRNSLPVPQPSAVPRPRGRKSLPAKLDSHFEPLVLWKYQAMDLKSIHQREISGGSGNILAYDMGLGKTIVAIALMKMCQTSSLPIGERRTNLVVVPFVNLSSQWVEEVLKFGGGLTVRQFERTMTVEDIETTDVILVTYRTVVSHHKARIKEGSHVPLFRAKFFRVILDEAHNISGRGAFFQACMELNREHGLCLTGTPVQNKLLEVQPLLEFLRVKVDYDLQVFENFQRVILENINDPTFNVSARVLADALKPCMFYRRKEDVVKLPELTIKFIDRQFTADEQAIHDWAQSGALSHTDFAWIRARQSGYQPFHFFGKYHVHGPPWNLNRLGCDHPYLLTTAINKKGEDEDVGHADRPASPTKTKSAPVSPAKPSRAPGTPRPRHPRTAHNTPRKSAAGVSGLDDMEMMVDDEGYALGLDPNHLPLALQPYTMLFQRTYISSKIVAVLEVINTIPDGEKAIIFCHYRTTISLLDIQLNKLKVETMIIHGDICPNERLDVLDSFASDPAKKVLLISMQTGGVGLNITCANHVLLVEPWWNPFAELQAFSRAHRIGQHKPVTVYKFCIQNSAEAHIVRTQSSKSEKVSAVLDRCVLPPMLSEEGSFCM